MEYINSLWEANNMESTQQVHRTNTTGVPGSLDSLSKLAVALAISVVIMVIGNAYNLLAEHGGNASTAIMMVSTLGMAGAAVMKRLWMKHYSEYPVNV